MSNRSMFSALTDFIGTKVPSFKQTPGTGFDCCGFNLILIGIKTAPVSIGAMTFAISGRSLIGGLLPLDLPVWCTKLHAPLHSFKKAFDFKWNFAVRFFDSRWNLNGQVNLGSVSGISETFTITFLNPANAKP